MDCPAKIMGKRQTRSPRGGLASGERSNDRTRNFVQMSWLASIALYASLLLLFIPTLQLTPISLDDEALLREFGSREFSSVAAYDRFGHLRPLKNLAFWLLARAPEALGFYRFIVLGAFLASVGLIQRLASRHFSSRMWAVLVAACWALNPISMTVVSWLSATNLVFCLLGLLVFVSSADYELGNERPLVRARARSVAVGLMGLLVALSSHEIALLAPALLLFYPRALRDRRTKPFIIGSLACVALLLALRLAGTAPSTNYRFDEHPPWLLVLSSARYLFENLSLWLWSSGSFGVLLVDQPNDHVVASALCWTVLILAGVVVFKLARRNREMAFGVCWVAIFLLPVTNIVPLGNTPVALHYLYAPSVGLAWIAVLMARQARAKLVEARSPRAAWLPAAILIGAIVSWLPEQRRSLHVWGDEVALYARTIANYPENLEARTNLASLYRRNSRPDEAAALLEESVRLAPDNQIFIRSYFEVLAQTKSPAEAVAFAERHSRELDTAEHLFTLGKLLERLGRQGDAVDVLRRAYESARRPDERLVTGSHLALVLVRTQQKAQAATLIDELLVDHPNTEALLVAKQLLSRP